MKYEDFYSKKRILITGHTGFVGCWMSMVLDYFNADLYGIALEAEEGALYSKVKKQLNIHDYICDLRESDKVDEIIKQINPEIVIHVAAYGFVNECFENPKRAFTSNVMGTVNLFEAIRKNKAVKSVLVISSDKVYQNKKGITKHSFMETENLGGIDPYSCSKTCEDLVAQSYFESYLQDKNVKVNIVRPGNILGGGDHIKSRLLPSMLNSFSEGKAVEIRHPDAIRPWQHILDAIDAYLSIIHDTYTSEMSDIGIYNVGPKPEGQMSVGQIAQYMARKIDGAKIVLGEKNPAVQEAGYLDVNIEKIVNTINWSPKKNMEQILDDVFEFWDRSKKEDSFDICKEQIEFYYS